MDRYLYIQIVKVAKNGILTLTLPATKNNPRMSSGSTSGAPEAKMDLYSVIVITKLCYLITKIIPMMHTCNGKFANV